MITRKKYEIIFKSLLESKFSVNINNIKKIESREGIIFTDEINVYKCLTFLNEQQELLSLNNIFLNDELVDLHHNFLKGNQLIVHFYLILKALSEDIKKNNPQTIINFDLFYIKNLIIIKMPFLNLLDFDNKKDDRIIKILKDFKNIGWLSLDFEPKNIKNANGNLIFIDIGIFFVPFYDEGYKIMCKRGYITYIFGNSINLKSYLRKAISKKDLSFLPNKEYHEQKFKKFYMEALK